MLKGLGSVTESNVRSGLGHDRVQGHRTLALTLIPKVSSQHGYLALYQLSSSSLFQFRTCTLPHAHGNPTHLRFKVALAWADITIRYDSCQYLSHSIHETSLVSTGSVGPKDKWGRHVGVGRHGSPVEVECGAVQRIVAGGDWLFPTESRPNRV